MATRIHLDNTPGVVMVSVLADEEFRVRKDRSVEPDFVAVPETWTQNAFGWHFYSLTTKAQILNQCSGDDAIPSKQEECLLDRAGAVVRPLVGIRVSDGLEVACDDRPRDEVSFEHDVERHAWKPSHAQLFISCELSAMTLCRILTES
jgi:hypothetical protein